jgi:hypothetical protein
MIEIGRNVGGIILPIILPYFWGDRDGVCFFFSLYLCLQVRIEEKRRRTSPPINTIPNQVILLATPHPHALIRASIHTHHHPIIHIHQPHSTLSSTLSSSLIIFFFFLKLRGNNYFYCHFYTNSLVCYGEVYYSVSWYSSFLSFFFFFFFVGFLGV